MFLIRMLARLPLSVLYLKADFLYFFLFYVFRYRRSVVRKNLVNSFPEKSEKQLRKIEREFYRRFTWYAVETLKVLSISKEDLGNRVRVLNPELLEEYHRNGHSIFTLASHQFNWEWGLLASGIHTPYEIDAVYQQLKNKKFDDLMIEIRDRFGSHPVEKSQVMKIVRDRHTIRGIGFVADQSPGKKIKPYWGVFMNQETAFFPSIEQLPKLTQYPVFYMKQHFVKRGHYTLEFIKIADPPHDKHTHVIMEEYIRATETTIREDPPGWLWSHNRWKRKKEV